MAGVRTLTVVLTTVMLATMMPVAATAAAPVVLGDEATVYRLSQPAVAFEDPTGRLGIDAVSRSNEFRPIVRPAENDQRPAVAWLRFAVDGRPADADRWFLFADETCGSADLFVPQPRGGFVRRGFGHSVPFERHPTPFGTSGIALMRDAVNAGNLYLRLECPRNTAYTPSIVSERWAWSYFQAHDVPIYCSIVAVGVFIVLALVFSMLSGERIYLFGALPVLAYGAIPFVGLFLPRIVPSIAMPPFTLTWTVLYVTFYIAQWAFIRQFLQLPAMQKQLDFWFTAALAMVCLATTIDYNGPFGAGSALVLAQIAFYSTPIVGGIVALGRGNRAARFFVIGLSAMALGIVFDTVVVDFGLASLNTAAIAFNIEAEMIESLMFFAGIADRLRTTILDRATALAESEAAKAQLVDGQARHITEIERRNAAFERFVPREFLQQLARGDVADVRLGDHVERSMSILFSDIRGFTGFAETLTPAQTFAFLNAYLERAGPVIRQTGGFVDKYIGDGIMALFPRSPADAVDAALTLLAEVRRFNETRARDGAAPIAIGIGINYGRLMLGTIGEAERYETTVLSDAVNVASRLEGLTKVYGVGIVAGEALVRELPSHRYHIRPLGTVQLKGLSRPETAYEIFDGDPPDLLRHKTGTLERFERALAAYRAGDFVASRDRFTEIAVRDANDRAAAWLRDRSSVMHDARLAIWDGIDRLDIK